MGCLHNRKKLHAWSTVGKGEGCVGGGGCKGQSMQCFQAKKRFGFNAECTKQSIIAFLKQESNNLINV